MKCKECGGKGYIGGMFLKIGSPLPIFVKVWCETCKGTGQIKWKGRRDGVAWEQE